MSSLAPPSAVRTLSDLYSWLSPTAGAVRSAFVAAHAEAQAARGKPVTPMTQRVVTAWDGGFSARTGRQTPCVWPQIVAFCDRHQLDPVLYAAYIGRVVGARSLDRSALLQPTFVQAFKQEQDGAHGARALHADDVLQTYLSALRVEIGKLQNTPGFPDEAARLREALSCVDVGSPLFRYCIAVRYGVADVAAALRRAALIEYRANRNQLVRGWSAIVPDEWKLLSVADLVAQTEAAR